MGQTLARWVDVTHRFALWFVLFASIITVALLYYTANNLGINTDTAEMLSETLPFRRNYGAFKTAFPQYDDAMLIVVFGLNGPEPVQPGGPLPAGIDYPHYLDKVLRPIADAVLVHLDQSFDEAMGQPRQMKLF